MRQPPLVIYNPISVNQNLHRNSLFASPMLSYKIYLRLVVDCGVGGRKKIVTLVGDL